MGSGGEGGEGEEGGEGGGDPVRVAAAAAADDDDATCGSNIPTGMIIAPPGRGGAALAVAMHDAMHKTNSPSARARAGDFSPPSVYI